MQRNSSRFLFLLFIGASAIASAQTNIPNLNEYSSKPRVFSPMGCKMMDIPLHKKLVVNYDMTESIARSDTFDIVHFNVDLDLTAYNLQQMEAHAEIHLSVIEDGAERVSFDLIGLTVDSVFIDNEVAAFSHQEGMLNIDAPQGGFSDGGFYMIDVYYGGHPEADPYWGGVQFAADYIYQMGIGLTSIPPNFGKVWHPCFDNFVERSTYTWNVRSAGGKKAHLQGTFIGEVLEEGDTLTRSFTLEHPITTHQAAFAVSNYVDSNYTHTGAYGDIPVRLTAKAEDIGMMGNRFQDLGYAIDALEYWYGPYAWERVGYILTPQGALEIPTNIAYPRYMVEESVTLNGDLLSHELGHQWWGNLVAPYIHNHMWLKEGGAEYSSHLFVEWKDGHEAFVDFQKDNQQFVLEECHVQDEGFHPLSPMPDDYIYGRHTYYKGAAIHHNLRAYMGDEMYRGACQTTLADHWDSYMDPYDFIESLENYSGMDLDQFFDAHIFQPGFSTWVVDSTSTVGGWSSGFATTLYLNQKLRACSNFHYNEPLDVTMWNTAWDTTLVEIRVGGEYDIATVLHDEPFVLIALNADGKLNQGRLDHTFAVTEATGLSSIPWVDLRVGCDDIGDSVLARVEHHWAAPDSEPLDFYFDEISPNHFWVIDGSWENGIEGSADLILDARFSYVGNNDEGLDYELFNDTEEDGFLAWRPNSDAMWVQCPDYTWQSGSMENGNGVFKVSVLRKGEYTFANGDISLNIEEQSTVNISCEAYPSPTSSVINLRWAETINVDAVSIYDMSGKCVKRSSIGSSPSTASISVVDLDSGNYIAVLLSGHKQLASSSFIVQ
jgi:hypothetical protein